MVNRNVTRRRSAGAAGALLVVGALLTPAPPAAAWPPPPEVTSWATAAEAVPCPPRDERGDDFPAPTRADVKELVEGFVTAHNERDYVALNAAFSDEPDFKWYFVQGERAREEASDRRTLLPYFAGRHVVNDRLDLAKLVVSRERGWHGGFDFFVRLERQSDDPKAAGAWHGKGAADCAIFTWSLGKHRS